jgi:uncharacterized membrane protein
MEWAAMELLRKALIVRARRVRLEDIILLLLRCLVLLLAGLAFARPAFRSSLVSWSGGGRAGIVVAVDASYSMNHKPGLRSRFDLARERAREVLATLSPGDPLTLVLLGDRPRILLRNAAYDAERAEAALTAAMPLQESINMEACVAEIDSLVAELGGTSRECYIITDAHALHWGEASEAVRATLKKISKAGALFLLPVSASGSENLAITRFGLASGILRKGSMNRFVVDVHNSGRAPSEGVTVRLSLDGTSVDQRILESIPPGKTETVSLFVRLDQPGISTLSATIADDALSMDNVRYAVVDIRSTVNILCIDGEPSNEPFQSETDFLLAALAPGGKESAVAANAPLRVDRISLEDLQIGKLASYDLVILANVPEVIQEQGFALADFVRRGGGLVLFLGDKTNADLMNERMKDADGKPFLPAQLLKVSDATAGGWTLSPAMPDHPVTRVLGALSPEELGGVHFSRYFRSAPAKDATVLLKMNPGDDPLLVEETLGRGHVLLFTSTADGAWTDMVAHPSYLMLVQQAVTCLTRKTHEIPLTVGEALTFDLPPEVDAKSVTIVDPKAEQLAVRVTEQNGGKVAGLPSADLAGLYEVRYAPSAPALKAAVNLSATESDVVALEGRALDTAARQLSSQLLEEGRDVRAAAEASRSGREIWRTLLALALLALVVEAVFARRFVRRTEEM